MIGNAFNYLDLNNRVSVKFRSSLDKKVTSGEKFVFNNSGPTSNYLCFFSLATAARLKVLKKIKQFKERCMAWQLKKSCFWDEDKIFFFD